MKLVIWGAGAIGGTLGAHLIRAGHDVLFVDRAGEHVEAMNRDGLQITGPIDEFHVAARACTPEQVSGQYTTIVLAVKYQATVAAATALEPNLAADGYVLSAQNGLNELLIAEAVGTERTIGAFVNFGADYMGPGVIHFGGRGAVVLGEIDGQMTPRLEALHRAFLDFEPNAILTDNVWGYLWGKMAYGAMLFATALTNESIADSLEATDKRPLLSAIVQEILVIAGALNVTPEGFNGFDPLAFMPGSSAEQVNKSFDAMVAFNRGSAKTHSGIWRDIAVRKRPTEVSMLEGVVSEGTKHGLPTPLTRRIIELIHDVEAGKRPQDLATLDALKASMA